MSQKYVEGKDIFLSFAKENRRSVIQIERVYYGAITDAIESCFAFDIEPDAYTVEATLAKDASYSDALGKAIELEKKIEEFHSDAAEQSNALMADVSRAFVMIAKKRDSREAKLKSFK